MLGEGGAVTGVVAERIRSAAKCYHPRRARLLLPFHVLAAAIRAVHGVEAKYFDAFVLELIVSTLAVLPAVVARQAADLQNPRRNLDDVLAMLEAIGLSMSVARLRELSTTEIDP